jgi:hypothetical protein
MSKLLRQVAAAAILLCLNAGAAGPADPRRLEALWDELATADPVKAERAVEQLVACPREAVFLLKERLQPAPSPDPGRLARLMADLDSEEFQVREAASCELGKVAEAVEADLRTALADRPSPEVRRRVEVLLENVASRRLCPTPERRREERVIDVLERIGDDPARELLGGLAQGAAAAALTRDARAALERLASDPAAAGPAGRSSSQLRP